MRWAWAVAAVVLAGCLHTAAPPAAPAVATQGALHGAVFDTALRPLPDAKVTIAASNASTTTDRHGLYSFPDLPRGQVLIVTASRSGYQTGSRQVTLPDAGDTRLDVVLDPVADTAGFVEVLKFSGSIGCQAAVVVSGQEARSVDCSAAADPGQPIWNFTVSPRLASAIVEVTWSSQSTLADGLGARLEHIGPDGKSTLLSEVVGRAPLRLVVPQNTSARLYAPSGGDARLTVYAMPVTAEDEQAAAVAAAADQTFQAFASLFYVVPASPTYSFVNPQ